MLVTGLVFLVAGVARLGFITQFLSKPVMDGFVIGLAVFVAVGQLNKLFGVPKPEGNTVEKLLGIIHELPEANWVTFAVGAVALALLFLLPRLNKKIPAGLVVLFGAIVLSTALDLEGTYGVEVVGTLPAGPAVAGPAARAAHDLPGDGPAGDRRPAGGLQRGARRGARIRREARLRGRPRPGAERPRRRQHRQRACSAA